MTFRERMGRRLRIARKARGYKQVELSEKLDASHNFVGNVERGLSALSAEKLVDVCDLLNVSADWLLGRTKSGGPNGANGGAK